MLQTTCQFTAHVLTVKDRIRQTVTNLKAQAKVAARKAQAKVETSQRPRAERAAASSTGTTTENNSAACHAADSGKEIQPIPEEQIDEDPGGYATPNTVMQKEEASTQQPTESRNPRGGQNTYRSEKKGTQRKGRGQSTASKKDTVSTVSTRLARQQRRGPKRNQVANAAPTLRTALERRAARTARRLTTKIPVLSTKSSQQSS